MKIVDITACIRVTKENDMYGMESYIDMGSKVKITFNIATEAPENDGEWVLNKDKGDELIKIQGYNDAPSGNPAPGQFKTYKGTETTIIVDKYNYYGIHLDMAKLVVTEVTPEE